MKKLTSSFLNMALSLFFISAVMAAALGFVYIKTKAPIAKAQQKKEGDAFKKVLPEFTELKQLPSSTGVSVFEATSNGSTVGYAVKTYSDKGFSGHISLIVGFLPDGSIYKSTVLAHKETPGLGDKMQSKWNQQFNGKNPETFKLKVKKDGGDVDAITAATISSRAFCDAVTLAYESLPKK